MHYAAIAQAIIDGEYRTSVGATPADTVASVLSTQLQDAVIRTRRGHYTLRKASLASESSDLGPGTAGDVDEDEAASDAEEMGLINAFGMFWSRREVLWRGRSSRLLGVQQTGSQQVDFAEQAGVYLLYDGQRVIYVGRVIEPRLAMRLWEHTRDRLTGRWDRFSWFGVRAVGEDGALGPMPTSGIELASLIATMEALLIEGLEPPQNRRQGDGFNAVEFLQVTDPEVELERKRALWNEMGRGLT